MVDGRAFPRILLYTRPVRGKLRARRAFQAGVDLGRIADFAIANKRSGTGVGANNHSPVQFGN